MSFTHAVAFLMTIALLAAILYAIDRLLAVSTDDGRFLIGHTLRLPGADAHASRPVRISAEKRLKHVYAIGGTGSGKTNLLLRMLASDIAGRRSVVVIDLRGDLVDRVLRLLAAGNSERLQDRLVLIDLRDAGHVVPINPLTGPGEAYGRALHVLSVIRKQADSWGIQLDETLRNALMALAEAEGSLLDLEPMLLNAVFRECVMLKVQDPTVRSFFSRYGELSAEKQVAWSLPVLNKISPLLCAPPLRRTFGARGSLDLGTLLDEPGRILLVSLAVDRLHEAANLAGGLIISGLQSAMMARIEIPEGERVPVHLYVDEFETMASERFESIIAEGRRFGLGLTLSHQCLSQMPARLRSVIRNNISTQLFFQTGAEDARELAGEVIAECSREEVRRALLKQQVGEAFVARRGKGTVQVRTPLYREAPVSKKALESVRTAGYARYAREAHEVEEELKGRYERSIGSGSEGGVGDGPRPTHEVRNVRAARGRA